MHALKDFSIPFKGLHDGVHQFEFTLDDAFFARYSESNIQKGRYAVKLGLDKRPDLLILDFEFSGSMNDECDRCLNPIDIPMEGEQRMMIKFSEEEIEEEEWKSISPLAHEINVAEMIYEMIHLSIPLKKVRDCESEEYQFCNEDILNSFEDSDLKSSASSIWNELQNLKWK